MLNTCRILISVGFTINAVGCYCGWSREKATDVFLLPFSLRGACSRLHSKEGNRIYSNVNFYKMWTCRVIGKFVRKKMCMQSPPFYFSPLASPPYFLSLIVPCTYFVYSVYSLILSYSTLDPVPNNDVSAYFPFTHFSKTI